MGTSWTRTCCQTLCWWGFKPGSHVVNGCGLICERASKCQSEVTCIKCCSNGPYVTGENAPPTLHWPLFHCSSQRSTANLKVRLECCLSRYMWGFGWWMGVVGAGVGLVDGKGRGWWGEEWLAGGPKTFLQHNAFERRQWACRFWFSCRGYKSIISKGIPPSPHPYPLSPLHHFPPSSHLYPNSTKWLVSLAWTFISCLGRWLSLICLNRHEGI